MEHSTPLCAGMSVAWVFVPWVLFQRYANSKQIWRRKAVAAFCRVAGVTPSFPGSSRRSSAARLVRIRRSFKMVARQRVPMSTLESQYLTAISWFPYPMEKHDQ